MQMRDLVAALNDKRNKKGLPLVSRQFTGAGYWLKTEEEKYKCIGRIFTSNDMFIGFLEGLLIEQ